MKDRELRCERVASEGGFQETITNEIGRQTASQRRSSGQLLATSSKARLPSWMALTWLPTLKAWSEALHVKDLTVEYASNG